MENFLAFTIGALTALLIVAYTPDGPVSLKEECEKSLPRGQTCVLIVIPKQETIQEK